MKEKPFLQSKTAKTKHLVWTEKDQHLQSSKRSLGQQQHHMGSTKIVLKTICQSCQQKTLTISTTWRNPWRKIATWLALATSDPSHMMFRTSLKSYKTYTANTLQLWEGNSTKQCMVAKVRQCYQVNSQHLRQCANTRKSLSAAPLFPWITFSIPQQRLHRHFLAAYVSSIQSDLKSLHQWEPPNTLRHRFARYGLPSQLLNDKGPTLRSNQQNTMNSWKRIVYRRC